MKLNNKVMIQRPGRCRIHILAGTSMLILFSFACRQKHAAQEGAYLFNPIADSLFTLAEIYSGADYGLAGLYLNQALELGGRNPLSLGRYHLIIGKVYYYQDRYDLSLSHLDSALACLGGGLEPDLQADCHMAMAASLRHKGKYPEAFSHNLEAIKLYQQTGNKHSLAGAYNQQGVMYLNQGSLEHSRSYLEKASELSSEFGESLLHANVLANLGKLAMAQEEIEKAGILIREAYEIRQRNTNIRHIATSLVQMAQFGYESRTWEGVAGYLEQAEMIYTELEEKVGLFNVYYLFSLIYTELGERGKAEVNAQKACDLAMSIDNPAQKEIIARTLYNIYKTKGEFLKALDYHEQYMEYHNALVSREKQRQIASIEYSFELEKQQRDNEILQHKNRVKKQQVILQMMTIVVLIIIITALLVTFRLRRKNNENRRALLEKENLLLENDLKVRNRELTGKTMELLHQNETMQSLAGRMEDLRKGDSRREIESILLELKVKNREHAWDEFHTAFNHVHRDFYDRLFAISPDLSSTEIRIAALLKLNLSTKEIAAISNKTESAVKTARHRLRTKLGLEQGQQLVPYLMKL